MANFCSYPKGDRISEVTLPNALDQGAANVVIGLWGPQDFDGKELHLLTPPYISVNKGAMKGQVRLYELSSYHPGRWTVEAVTDAGATWDRLTIIVKERRTATPNGHKYTTNANETPTKTTTPSVREVVAMLRQSWSQLTETGARTLTAQFMHETSGGKNCFNWNLGNVKSGPNDPHMYLRGVWEVDSPSGGDTQIANSNGLGRLATPEEIRKHGWSCPAGKVVVVFEPPHPQCRFRAYSSLQDGAQRWVTRHQGTAQADPSFLTALNNGDCTAVAHKLKQIHYYSGGEADYAHGMTTQKAGIDRLLGAQ